jgi:hypothetical protein
MFTQEELEVLDNLDLEPRRSLDRKVTRNDLARCAVQMLIEDYAQDGERCYTSHKR